MRAAYVTASGVGARMSQKPSLREASSLRDFYARVRAESEALAAPLSPEDQGVQSMPDASPTKWHLAHTSWFFETVVLEPHCAGYAAFDARFKFLFNSYYESLGPRHPRPQRGVLTRPSAQEILAYRRHVDAAMLRLLESKPAGEALAHLVTLGLHHEQQHQELILTDIKHAFSLNSLSPSYARAIPEVARPAPALEWIAFEGGLAGIGHADPVFAFDNEKPRHRVMLQPFRLASRPVTNGEYAEFIADGGYTRPEFWLSDGRATVQGEGWFAPLYWREAGENWNVFTLHGEQPLRAAEPVAHVSFFEAAAYAAWSGKRLPTEFEWEHAARGLPVAGNLLGSHALHPRAAEAGDGPLQMFGDVWEWTRSSYDPYPGFRPFDGAIAEYNGKFMIGQMILRGGSCATPEGHIRPTYRNFFPPAARWQFSGIRLAEDL
jgi:ergothioneine biosynthesis protein EgtB